MTGDQPGGDSYLHREITEQIIGAAIEVHKILGPGLLEAVYEEALCHELGLRNISIARQVPIPVVFKCARLDCGYRLDMLAENEVIVELKCVDALQPVQKAQLITYLRLSGKRVGLLINFNVDVLRNGIVRRVL